MRIAVVSDIHGSRAALEAVRADLRKASPDVVVHGGDLVVNGPHPNFVVDLVRSEGWSGVIGNTDEMLWKLDELEQQLAAMPKLEPLLRVMYEHTAPAALERLDKSNLQWLQELSTSMDLEHIRLLHASPTNLWRAPAPQADDQELAGTFEVSRLPPSSTGTSTGPLYGQYEESPMPTAGASGSPGTATRARHIS